MKKLLLVLLCCILMSVLPACSRNIKNDPAGEAADGEDHSYETLLASADTLSSNCEVMYTLEKPTSTLDSSEVLNIIQGGTTDGVYYYQAFIKKDKTSGEADNIVRIVKCELATGKVVLTSDNLSLNHANDIAYNAKEKELIVVHNAPYRSLISILDPDTLTVKDTRDIGIDIFCISYNEAHDEYVVGISGTQNFQILNSDFTVKSGVCQPTERTAGYTNQGGSCDDNFIYFILYDENVISVYDWNGDFVTLIELNVDLVEPESVTVINDEIYIGCATYGAKVFRVIPIAKTE